jgi:hypothetical protein
MQHGAQEVKDAIEAAAPAAEAAARPQAPRRLPRDQASVSERGQARDRSG